MERTRVLLFIVALFCSLLKSEGRVLSGYPFNCTVFSDANSDRDVCSQCNIDCLGDAQCCQDKFKVCCESLCTDGDSLALGLGLVNCANKEKCLFTNENVNECLSGTSCAVKNAYSCIPKATTPCTFLNVTICTQFTGCKIYEDACTEDCLYYSEPSCLNRSFACDYVTTEKCSWSDCNSITTQESCNEKNGCRWDQLLNSCRKTLELINLQTDCFYEPLSDVCLSWDYCDINLESYECTSYRSSHCCGSGKGSDSRCLEEEGFYSCSRPSCGEYLLDSFTACEYVESNCGYGSYSFDRSCAQSYFVENCCGYNCGDDGNLLSNYPFLSCDISCQTENCQGLNCKPASEFKCVQNFLSNSCSVLDQLGCESDSRCQFVTPCYANLTVHSKYCEREQKINNNCPSSYCYLGEPTCEPKCEYISVNGCQSDSNCLASFTESCQAKDCSGFSSHDCSYYQGCGYNNRISQCFSQDKFFNLTKECPFAENSPICKNWHICNLNSNGPECVTMVENYCCRNDGGIFEDQGCRASLNNSNVYICDRACPTATQNICAWSGDYLAVTGRSGDGLYIFAHDGIVVVPSRDIFLVSRSYCDVNSPSYLVNQTLDIRWSLIQEGSFMDVLIQEEIIKFGRFGFCNSFNNEQYILRTNHQAKYCIVPDPSVCSYLAECTNTDIQQCLPVSDEPICSPLNETSCESNPSCKVYGKCTGPDEYCSNILSQTLCLENSVSNNCMWEKNCQAKCDEFDRDSCGGICFFKEDNSCVVSNCSKIIDIDECSWSSGCQFDTNLNQCKLKKGRRSKMTCPLFDQTFCGEYTSHCDTNFAFFNQTACNITIDKYCCQQGFPKEDPFCNTVVVDCKALSDCGGEPTFGCTELFGIYNLLGYSESSNTFINITDSPLPIKNFVISPTLFSLTEGNRTISGKVFCEQIDGFSNINLEVNQNFIIRGTINPRNYVSLGLGGYFGNVSVTTGFANDCSRYKPSNSVNEWFMRDAQNHLTFCKAGSKSQCISPLCRSSTSPSCIAKDPSDMSQYDSCLTQQTSQMCLNQTGCQWVDFSCFANECVRFEQSNCDLMNGCAVYDNGLCQREVHLFNPPCPFYYGSNSLDCYDWDKCVPGEERYDLDQCRSTVEPLCCSRNVFDRPSICDNLLISCSNCGEETWGTCPEDLFNVWTSKSIVLGAPRNLDKRQGVYDEPEWRLTFSLNKTATFTRVFPPNANINPLTSSRRSFATQVLCRGNSTSEIKKEDLEYKLEFRLNSGGISSILRGMVSRPGNTVMNSTLLQGRSIVPQENQFIIIVDTFESCNFPTFSKLFPDQIGLARSVTVPPTTGLTCSSPFSIVMPESPIRSSTRVPLTISPNLFISNCVPPTTVVTAIWTISPSINLLRLNSLSLSIPRQTLPVGSYMLYLTVSAPGFPSVTSSNITLVIQSLPPVVLIQPANTVRSIQLSQPLTLNASASFSSNTIIGQQPPILQCSWSCSYLSSSDPCPSFNQSSCDTVIGGNQLIAGMTAVFSLSVLDPTWGSPVTREVRVVVFEELSAAIELRVQDLSPNGYVNSQIPVRVFGRVRNTFERQNFTNDIRLVWSSIERDSSIFVSLDPSNLQTPNNTFNLVFKPNALKTSSKYILRLDAFIGNISGFAEISFFTYSPPSSGSFLVEPTSGVFRNTSFILSAPFWSDPQSEDLSSTAGLTFNFGVENQGKTIFLLTTPTPSYSLATFNLPLGINNLYAYIYSQYGTTIVGPVQVEVVGQLNTTDQIKEVSSQVDLALRKGDINQVIQLINLITQSLNALNDSSNEITEIRSNLLEAIEIIANLTEISEREVETIIPLILNIISDSQYINIDITYLVFDLITKLVSKSASVGSSIVQIFSIIQEAINRLDLTNSQKRELSQQIESLFTQLLFSVKSSKACNENPSSFLSSSFRLRSEFKSQFGGVSYNEGEYGYSFGESFSAKGDSDSFEDESCSQFHAKNSETNPYSWKNIPAGQLQSICNVVTLNLYNSEGNSVNVSNLSENEAFKVIISCDNSSVSLDELTCVFWDEAKEKWSTDGCVKVEEESTRNQLVCKCTHLTSFSIGSLVISTNIIDPINDAQLLTKLLSTKGGRRSIATVCVLFVLYLIALPLAIYFEVRDRKIEREPKVEDLDYFINQFAKLYRRTVAVEVIETRRIDIWKEVYEVDKEEGYVPNFWQKLKIHMKHGFRYNHLYLSVFFTPLTGYTRPERITVAWTILYLNLAVNAFLYQFDENNTRILTLAAKMFSAFISSIIVFIPTTFVGYLFRRTRRRHDEHKYIEDQGPNYIQELGLTHPENLDVRGAFTKILFEWHLPWWVQIILYIVTYFGWLFAIYSSLIYGVKFDDETAVAFFQSFGTSVAISIFVLQTLKAMIGGLFITITSGVVSIAAITALLVGGNMVAMT